MDNVTGDSPRGGSGERATGTPNTIYDLSSVLFHALEGGASYDTYIEDAEREGDQELADFFRLVRDEDSNRADEAQRLLAERTTTTATSLQPTEGSVGAPSEGLAAGAPRREETTGVPPSPGREEDRGLLDRARDALSGEDEPRRDDPREVRGGDDPLMGRP